jgi:non-canonical purine NTP pyrophosphatase (RdgB/HAM1 family)
MKELIFVTSNKDKFALANKTLKQAGVSLIQETHEIDEIQGEDGALIALDKARRAYDIIGQPLIANDDSWEIHGLNGFPGPYMKSINSWFTPDDFLNLTRHLKNRDVSLVQYTVFKDGSQEILFKKVIKGVMLKEARGNQGPAIVRVVSLTSDGKSIAESYHDDWGDITIDGETVWDDLVSWLKEN